MRIAVDLAHGFPKDRGEEGIIAEEEVINEVGVYLIKKLRSLGHDVILVRPTRNKKNDSLSKRNLQKIRANYSNESDVDLVLSMHASIGMGTGTEAYTYKANNYKEATMVLENLSSLGFMNRGIKNGAEIYIIKATKARTIVLSICFIDTLFDVNNYHRVGAQLIANAIAYGIDNKSISKNDLINQNILPWIDRLKDELTVQGYHYMMETDISKEKVITYAPKVMFGARGNITKLIQEKLALNCDGIFGNETRNALVEYQKVKNINITGIVDYNTWKEFIK